MIKFRWYRWFKVLLGYRSFVKHDPISGPTHALIKGSNMHKIVNMLKVMSYEEEWPSTDSYSYRGE
jgi:hypothetical protein